MTVVDFVVVDFVVVDRGVDREYRCCCSRYPKTGKTQGRPRGLSAARTYSSSSSLSSSLEAWWVLIVVL